MAKFIFLMDGAFLGEYKIEKKRFVIGRFPISDIHIDSLAISGQHASISFYRGKHVLKDLASTNGTMVNGERVEKHTLKHLDIIQMSKYQLKYVENDVDVGFSGFEKTVLVPSTEKRKQHAPALNSATNDSIQAKLPLSNKMFTQKEESSAMDSLPKSVSPLVTSNLSNMRGKVMVLSGVSKGKELLLNKGSASIGKPGVQLAEISRQAQNYVISHMEGAFPIVNGATLSQQGLVLSHDDVFEVAGVKMVFLLEESKSVMTKIAQFFKRFF